MESMKILYDPTKHCGQHTPPTRINTTSNREDT